MLDLVGTQIVVFLMHKLIFGLFYYRTTESLFGGVPANQSNLDSSISMTTWCDCANTSGHCAPQELVQTCDFIEAEDITSIMTVAPYARASDNDGVVDAAQSQRRRKRQAVNTGTGIDFGDGDDEDLSVSFSVHQLFEINNVVS